MQEYSIAPITSTPTLGLIKMSIVIQYYNLFGVIDHVRYSVWVLITP